uniref:EF-hand domain-containing protein n=1 Tax=Hemiselmis andersenii TaxID=464988 RepID=A0A6U2BID2_HEMAN|mmetsp:Transcript_16721/g.38601  ORF Transcript_16721/g.38601 Transcript_16721/m.38601 type:complete len:338 (+) Transcript_16721:230-1243(+)
MSSSKNPLRQAGASILMNTDQPRPPSQGRVSLDLSGSSNSALQADYDVMMTDAERFQETPRTAWRSQYWSKSTPWGTDRRQYTADALYRNNTKPTTVGFDHTKKWHQPAEKMTQQQTAEDMIRTVVEKLEQHCRSTFMLTKMFKFFDKDNSNTIDREELANVLNSFSIMLDVQQLDAIMAHFGAVRDSADSTKFVIRYTDFISALDRLNNKHPLDYQKAGRFSRERRTLSPEGKRLCTPGHHAPVGCPSMGSFWPEDRHATRMTMRTSTNSDREIVPGSPIGAHSYAIDSTSLPQSRLHKLNPNAANKKPSSSMPLPVAPKSTSEQWREPGVGNGIL